MNVILRADILTQMKLLENQILFLIVLLNLEPRVLNWGGVSNTLLIGQPLFDLAIFLILAGLVFFHSYSDDSIFQGVYLCARMGGVARRIRRGWVKRICIPPREFPLGCLG